MNTISKTLLLLLFISLPEMLYAQENNKVDHNHAASGGYGYWVNEDAMATLWWTEGVYKVLQEAPIPKKVKKEISLSSAKNEWESFQIIVNPKTEIKKFEIALSVLTEKNGAHIAPENVTIRKVEYVNVTHPTDIYGIKGKYPDPLPLYTQSERLLASKNQPFWISIKVPQNTLAADYKGVVTVSSGNWRQEIPVILHVWDFALPSVPTMRSGFGMSLNNIATYDNLHTNEQKSAAFESYMKAFRDYKISPYNPFELNPIEEEVMGVPWVGGLFDNKEKHTGLYSMMVVDNSVTENKECTNRELIAVNQTANYQLKWWAKSKEDRQPFVVGVECYDAERKHITFENRFESFEGSTTWKEYNLNLGNLEPKINYIKIRIYPSNRTLTGENKGTVWFDDLALTHKDDNKNLFPDGDFEVDLDKIDIKLNFDNFNRAAKKYFGEYGFTGYNLKLKGIGGGTYYSRNGGVFEGFSQGTDEYNKLMQNI